MHVDGKSTGSINQATYKINHNILENKLTLKDFDEVVDNHLTFNNDIAEKVNNAKKIIGLIQRNLSTLIYVMKLWARKSSLTATKQPGGKFFYHLPACRVECVLKYIFSFKKNTHTNKKQKKLKTKREKQNKPKKKTRNKILLLQTVSVKNIYQDLISFANLLSWKGEFPL